MANESNALNNLKAFVLSLSRKKNIVTTRQNANKSRKVNWEPISIAVKKENEWKGWAAMWVWQAQSKKNSKWILRLSSSPRSLFFCSFFLSLPLLSSSCMTLCYTDSMLQLFFPVHIDDGNGNTIFIQTAVTFWNHTKWNNDTLTHTDYHIHVSRKRQRKNEWKIQIEINWCCLRVQSFLKCVVRVILWYSTDKEYDAKKIK